MAAALLLDVGHVIIEPSWMAVRAYEAATGTTMPRPDDVSVEPDDRWQDETSGDPVGDRYWDEVARRAGLDGIVELFRVLGKEVPEALFDSEAVTLIQDACSAAVPVGHSQQSRPHGPRPRVVRCPAGVRRGHGVHRRRRDRSRRSRTRRDICSLLQALGVAPDEVVFLDDTPACAEGARAVGMSAILVDARDRRPAFDEARRLLGLA